MFDAPEVSDLRIDRYLADELPASERDAFERELEQTPALQSRLNELRASRAAFSLSAPSFEAVLSSSSSSSAPSSSSSSSSSLWSSWWRRFLDGIVAHPALSFGASVGMVAVVVGGLETATRPDHVDVRSKGAWMSFVVERDGVVRDGHAGMTLRPGDRVQFSVDAGDGAWVGVWSVDGRGVVSAYAPALGEAVGLEYARGRHAFANSTRLDDVVGDERLVGLRCAAQVPRAVIQGAISAGEAIAGCELGAVTVKKVPRGAP